MLVTAPYQKRSHHVNVVSRLLSYFSLLIWSREWNPRPKPLQTSAQPYFRHHSHFYI